VLDAKLSPDWMDKISANSSMAKNPMRTNRQTHHRCEGYAE
jgi:hypothetical protein